MATQNLGRVRFAPQGAWNSATSYSFFDLVSHQGAAYAYVAATPSAGIPPGDVAVWQLVAAKGEAGANGAAGPQGPAGDKGDKPAHQWSGPSLRFATPPGSWGGYVNLQGPQGAQGSPGSQGPQGGQGPTGATGPQGPQGPAGGSNCNCNCGNQ